MVRRAQVILHDASRFEEGKLPQKEPPATTADEPTKKRHALLTFGYCGTGYYGLQSQHPEGDPERPTVSDVLRRALLGEGFIAPSNFSPLRRTKWSLASRTDKGVHAAGAAASVNLELRSDDVDAVVPDEQTFARDAPAGEEWTLSASALDRVNAALPAHIRIFSAGRVRKRFDARECASSRTYEYLLPLSALGGCEPDEFDAILRRFEGTHRFHNFASGLRRAHEEDFEVAGNSSDAWPLALQVGAQTSAAFRSVFTCRVHRHVTLEEPYLVVRIAGLSFVLHQIRHIIGAALAVANRLVPVDVLEIALTTPFRIDISPLAPGCGLLLDEIQWFDNKEGRYEAQVPVEARQRMEAFKNDVLYPHISSLYRDGTFATFLGELRTNNFTKHYDKGDYERLRRVHVAWREHVAKLAAARSKERALRREEYHAEREEAEAGAPEQPQQPKRHRRPPKERELPGGMLIKLCATRQILPGPATHRAITLLKAKVANGELLSAQPYEYYLEALDRYEAGSRDAAAQPWVP